MKFPAALDLFECTLLTERDRPDVHAAMLKLALPETITSVSSQLQEAIAAGERVWMTADLHIGHANIIPFCNRPFANVVQMNEHLVAQTAKVQDDEWLVIVGDLADGVDLPGSDDVDPPHPRPQGLGTWQSRSPA